MYVYSGDHLCNIHCRHALYTQFQLLTIVLHVVRQCLRHSYPSPFPLPPPLPSTWSMTSGAIQHGVPTKVILGAFFDLLSGAESYNQLLTPKSERQESCNTC